MKREVAELAAGIIERIDRLEKTIFELQGISGKESYIITSVERIIDPLKDDIIIKKEVELNKNEIATEVFVQNILEFFIDNLNLELEELRKELDGI